MHEHGERELGRFASRERDVALARLHAERLGRQFAELPTVLAGKPPELPDAMVEQNPCDHRLVLVGRPKRTANLMKPPELEIAGRTNTVVLVERGPQRALGYVGCGR